MMVKKKIRKNSNEKWKPMHSTWRIVLQPKAQSLNQKDTPTYSSSIDLPMSSSWQVHNGNPKDEMGRAIVIGFDFGTSCTKIVIRDSHRKEAYAIPFVESTDEFKRYLFPTKIYVNYDGSIGLTEGDTVIDGLKVRLINNPEGYLLENLYSSGVATSLDIAAAYIGLVLKHTQNWFKKNKAIEYQHFQINWQLNIGLPSRSSGDERLNKIMKLVGLGGWNLSLLNKDRFSITDVKEAITVSTMQIKKQEYNKKVEQLHPGYVNSFPEIIAEVLSYVRSPSRRPGMYLMVDVGARTMDVSSFIIHESEEDEYHILTAEVVRLGAYILHQNRIEACKKIIEQKFCDLISLCDGISSLPDRNNYLPMPTDNDREALDVFDGKFRDECSIMIRKIIKKTKDCRNPHSSAWRDGFPAFLCGGGAHVSLYQSLFRDIQDKLRNSKYNLTFEMKDLPLPRALKNSDIPRPDFSRIAVAYGLSYPIYDIGNIIPPEQIEDIVCSPEIRDITEWYIDKDMV